MKPKEPLEFANSISGLIDLSQSLHHVNKILESTCGLSIVQWSLLKTLIQMPAVSPLILAKALKVTPGTLSQTLGRLDKKGFLFMCDDPSDARKKMISITRLGKDALETADQEYKRIFEGVETIHGGIAKIDNYLKKEVKERLLQMKTQEPCDLLENASLNESL